MADPAAENSTQSATPDQSSDQQFSPQDITDLDQIAKALPKGDPRVDKINGVIRDYQGKLIAQKTGPQPGVLSTLGSDLAGAAKGAWHAAVDPLTETHEDLVNKLHQEQASDAAETNSPERRAHGAFYRSILAPT
jgi:hypothetical protein